MNGYREFVAIVDAGSVSQAARDLGVPRASLSRQLSALESRLGVRLLHRTTRKLTPTRGGEDLYDRARRILDAVCEAEAAVRQESTPAGLLRISVPPVSGNGQFEQMLLDFVRTYPDIELHVVATTRHVDLVGEDIDVSIRAGRVLDPSLYARRIMSSEVRVMAAPSYLQEHGTPTLETLSEHVLLRHTDQGRPMRTWPLRRGGQVQISGKLVSNDLSLLRRACMDGMGLALLPEAFTDGALVPVLPQVGATTHVSLVYAERQYQSPRVRAFIDHVVAAL